MKEEENVSVPRATIFRIAMLVMQGGLLIGVFWVRAEIHKELKEYVSHSEFDVYKSDHEKWSREVVTRLQGTVDEVKHQIDRMESKVDRLSEKRSAMIPIPMDDMFGGRLKFADQTNLAIYPFAIAP